MSSELTNYTDVTFLKLAYEIAAEIDDLETILKHHNIGQKQWEIVQKSPTFRRYLESAVAAWTAATNTPERVKLKSASAVEQWIPKLYEYMNDPEFPLPAKVEAGKLMSRLAGLGMETPATMSVGEKVSITINLGDDRKLNFEKDITKVIEHEAAE